MNVKAETKKLRLSKDKCYKIHIAKRSKEVKSCDLTLNVNGEEMKSASEAKYLGDVLNAEGTVDSTIEERRQKGIGIANQISSMPNSISLGFYYIDIAMMLREAKLVNGTLTNAEVWPYLNKENLSCLEAADLSLMRTIFKAHSKTVCELFFLETGKILFRFVIYKRRLMYLRQLVTINETELTQKVYSVQKLKETKGNWFQVINEIKEIASIDKKGYL